MPVVAILPQVVGDGQLRQRGRGQRIEELKFFHLRRVAPRQRPADVVVRRQAFRERRAMQHQALFAVVNDRDHLVELIIDEAVWAADKIQGHPLRNTATVVIGHASLEAFLAHTGHVPRVMRVP